MRLDRTSSVGQAAGKQRRPETLDLGLKFANLTMRIAEKLSEQERFSWNVRECHG
jgi:hypothetical protein